MTKVKICGITSLEDALLSAKFGADALGFNFYAKSPRYISPEKTREIIEQIPKEILKVGVFVNESLEKIIEIAQIAKLNAIQLHGEETPEFAKELKQKTNLEIIKAFRVSPEFKPEDVLRYDTDAILLDAYNPKEHGGTGETFDWKIAFKARTIVSKLYLAGGLDSQNVDLAIRHVQPFAVDSCSLLEKGKGKKDKQKVFRFIAAVKDHKNFEVKDIYDLLFLIELRPAMYLGKQSITLLRMFLNGFDFASVLNNLKFDWKNFCPDGKHYYDKGFQSWIAKKFLGKAETALGWDNIILEKSDNDEKKAFELFFELLEEFKLEKENLSNE
jgi:phosphoribosylanthranilate isomerase